ncbi:MAG: restriction endonuclease subunit S, partial [Actinobacteria bacterium]|nr:restriction endonuclease subunit S [Actinomycetota bacterium]
LEGVPWVRSQELVDRRISQCGEHITPEGLKGSSAKVLPPKCILVAMYGATVGKLGYLEIEAATNQAICALITDPEIADARFLYYALMHDRPRLVASAQGAAQQNLSQASIREFTLRVPGVGVQRRIAKVLGEIDDLFENSWWRVKVLEEMARAIYREWFVRFRYPGHADVPLVDSPLGPIPEGWSVGLLADLATLDRPNTQPAKSPEQMFDHFSIPAFDDGQRPARDAGVAIRSGKYLLSSPAVLVSKLNPRIDRVWFVEPTADHRSVGSTEFLILRPTTRSSLEHLYLLARDAGFREQLTALSAGTSGSHQRAKPVDFLNLPAVIPPRALVDRLDAAVSAQLRLARQLRRASHRLADLRDLLLPKLVTGQIDVPHRDLDALLEGSTV